MNSAQEYAKLIERMYRQAGNKTATKIWQGFFGMAKPYDAVDWPVSRMLAKKYRCEPKYCFQNALMIAKQRPELQYCEGFATNVIPTEHAWLVAADGRVVDPTWVLLFDDPSWFGRAADYFGIVLPVPDVVSAHAERATEPLREMPAWLPTILRQLPATARLRQKKRR